mgnify:CR=1 FL=1
MDWLDQLSQLRDEDQKQQEELSKKLDLSVLGRRDQAKTALKVAEAHNLLRRMNAVLLGNKGLIDVFDSIENYDEAITLVWQGPISQARRPNPDNPAPVSYVMISAKGRNIYVNHKKCQITPEAMKAALVQAAQNPLKKA